MNSKVKALIKLNAIIFLYAFIVCLVGVCILSISFINRSNSLIKSTSSSIQNNISLGDLEELNEYVGTIFSSRNISLGENEVNKDHVSAFGHLKEYEEYKTIQREIDLIKESNRDIYDLGILYIDIDNNRMVYLADSGAYDLGVCRGLSYDYYTKLVLKKNASIGKVNNKLCIYKGGNLTNEKSVVVGTVTISVSIARWIANVRIFIIALVIICLITCLICSICYLYIPDFYRNAYAYLKATKVIYKARKERKERLKEQRQQTKKLKKESLDGFKEELEKNDINENDIDEKDIEEKGHVKEIESIEENVQEKEIESNEENVHEKEEEKLVETDTADDKPKSIKREVKEGEEDHPVMDWIVDQLK